MNYVDIGVFLRIARDELRISQEDAAEVVGISDRTLRNIENGETVTDTETLFRFCDFYGISGVEIWLFYKRDLEMEQSIRDYRTRKAHKTGALLLV